MITVTIIMLMLLASLLGALGAYYLKKGSGTWELKINKVANKEVVIGATLYAVSAGTFVLALREGNLSVVFPLSSLTYIFAAILATTLLKEKINKYKWAALFLILAGNVLISL